MIILFMRMFQNIFKKNIFEEICFEKGHYDNIKFINDNNNNIKNKISFYYKGNYACVKLPDKVDELFFYNHYLWFFGYPLVSNSPIYYSLLTGNEYYQSIPMMNSIGYIPLNIYEDFNFITYKIYTSSEKDIIYFWLQ